MGNRTPECLPFQWTEAGFILLVRLTPKSAADRIEGIAQGPEDAYVKARVRAAPEGGRANEALIRLVANWLDIPPSHVSLKSGGRSRMKQVLISGDQAVLRQKLNDRLQAG